MPSPQYRYWILTIPHDKWTITDGAPEGIQYLKGQLEKGEGGYLHWQLVAYTKKKCTYSKMMQIWGIEESHIEHTRSGAAEEYVWKDETSEGERFEMGDKSKKRNCQADWDDMFDNAKKGRLDEIPADVKIRCWNQFLSIGKYYLSPSDRGEVKSRIYWGVPNSGKTHLAKLESGYFDNPEDVYMKSPTTKFWDGYRGQSKVIIDEFEGQINLSHLKVWCDPSGTACQVEVKGGAVALQATEFWITSNNDWRDWYATCSANDRDAIKRRFEIKQFEMRFNE